MRRLLENRIFGGVCSGLGAVIPINVWLWRVIWIALTIITGGAAALLYVMWWWLLPEQSFNDIEVGRFLPTIGAIGTAGLVIGGWVTRDSLVSETGAELYIPILLILTSLVYLSQQFDRGKNARNHPILGAVAVAVSGFFLVGALGAAPSGILDTVSRALPAVLIFFGLSIILRERLPLGSLIALAVSLALPIVIATVAFSGRIEQVLEDNVVVVEQDIEANATQLTLDMTALNADVELRTGTTDSLVIATFTGSTEHDLNAEFAIDDQNFAILVLTETLDSAFPSLTAVGRGTIDVQLPPEFPVFVKLRVADGDVTLNFRDLDLESIESLDVESGQVLLTLPAYQPLSPSALDSGVLNVLGGDLTIFVPDNLGAELFMSKSTNNRPEFDDLSYLLEDRGNEWRLSQRDFDNLPIKASYIISAPAGTVSIETIE